MHRFPTFTGSFAVSLDGASFSGGLGVHADACGIHPSASGSCSMDAAANGALSFSVVLGYDGNGCTTFKVDSIQLSLPRMSLTNIHVDIDFSGLHIDVGPILNFINSQVSGAITDALDPILEAALSKFLPSLLTNAIQDELSQHCIPFPGHGNCALPPKCTSGKHTSGSTAASCETSPAPGIVSLAQHACSRDILCAQSESHGTRILPGRRQLRF